MIPMTILVSVVIALVATYRACHWVKLDHTVIASTTASRRPALRLLAALRMSGAFSRPRYVATVVATTSDTMAYRWHGR